MNYYERHIGDYIRDTVSLSMVEDGAYNRLMDQYYQTERPLSLDKKMVYRLARATTTAERKAVDFVLDYFFDKEEDGYHQKRINAEIERYQEKQRKAKASANARWNKSERNANASKTHDASDMRTHSEGNAHQAPSTKHQTPDTIKKNTEAAASTTVEGQGPEPAALPSGPVQERKLELVSMLRKRGAALQAGDPRVERWAANGVTDAQALQALEIAQQRREAAGSVAPINAGYLDSILGDLSTTGTKAAQPRTRSDRYASEAQQINAMAAQADAELSGRIPKNEIDMGAADATDHH